MALLRSLMALAAAAFLVAAQPAGQTYFVDSAASSLSAKVPFFGLGRKSAGFPEVAGTIKLDRARPQNIALDVTIDATKLTAGDDLTLNRLKGERFFWVERHPTVRFVGREMKMTSPTRGSVDGDLTARGVTKPVTLDVTFDRPPAEAAPDDIIALTGTTRINRYDFGMKSYRLIVGKYVNIELRARMVPKP
ncbi:YceI family protein [Altererythrobacter ishigakiensis]|uniref:Polyisoprenoid-binding protein YceI n=1 Tax=Altererythrobacter ishigakiensis TaxID=476157 RepID=A0A562UU02_9SPHN|nr:YceI family protein [Altererythrobacter ishigakiensis]TWJ09095.1 polyisoprenoid-binding protein YceI [Altererythrobacter ishigakiensis]